MQPRHSQEHKQPRMDSTLAYNTIAECWHCVTRHSTIFAITWPTNLESDDTVNERQTQQCDHPEPASHSHRRVRCFFVLCVLHFCTDHRCSMPLHTLLTAIVETCGGSSKLVHILNRLGAVSSSDTHDRYVQYTVTKQLQQDEIPRSCTHWFYNSQYWQPS